jgi:hypothetical protein
MKDRSPTQPNNNAEQKHRRPQARAHVRHRECDILVERTGLRNMSFTITGAGIDFRGYSNQPGSCRRFAHELKPWLDKELRRIEDLSRG